MKRVRKAFAAGARVYPAGAELPDDHPAVKASPGLFEDVPDAMSPAPSEDPDQKPEESKPSKPKKKSKTKADGQGQKGETGADGDT